LELTTTIPERDVLVATALWLKQRGAIPYRFSVARGRGIDLAADTATLREACLAAGLPDSLIKTVASGPDVIALSRTEFWQVECKGSGAGTPQTQRNNFDRALASTVSYYVDEPPDDWASEFPDIKSCLGLALPASRLYLNGLRQRVRKPLRRRLNLWVLLYDARSKSIRAVPPDEEV
jgi:hypothetical protein